jgi:hypothetical protein
MLGGDSMRRRARAGPASCGIVGSDIAAGLLGSRGHRHVRRRIILPFGEKTARGLVLNVCLL